jgi:hypothetical protein
MNVLATLVVALALALGCGGSSPPPSPQTKPEIYPTSARPDPCPNRGDVLLACFDLGAPADADCAKVVAAKEAELTGQPCRASLVETCAKSCDAARTGRDRNHYYQVMTSPPPS